MTACFFYYLRNDKEAWKAFTKTGELCTNSLYHEVQTNIDDLNEEMTLAAQNLQFERAAQLRDKIKELEERIQMNGK